jgi:PAS domain S-box-containing protein
MQALLVTGDAEYGAALAADLGGLPQPVTTEIATGVGAALDRLTAPGIDAAIVDLVHPPPGTGAALIELARHAVPDLPLIAVLGALSQTLVDAITAGADGFVRESPKVAEHVAEALKNIQERRRTTTVTPLRLLYVSRTEPMRDASLANRLSLDTVMLGSGVELPPPHDTGPITSDAVVIDMSGGATDLLAILQDSVNRTSGQPIVVLTDAGDRSLATAALRLGAQQVIAKSGAWPVRLWAAIEQGAMARRAATDVQVLRSSEARLRILVESLPVGITVMTREGTVLAMNAAGLEALGVAGLDNITKTNLAEKLSDEGRTAFESFLQSIGEGSRQTVRVGLKDQDEKRILEISGAPLARGGGSGRMVLASITLVSAQEPALTSSVPGALAEGDPAAHGAAVDRLQARLTQAETGRSAADAAARRESEAAEVLRRQLAETAGRHDAEVADLRRELLELRSALSDAEAARRAAVEARREESQRQRAVGEGESPAIEHERRELEETRLALRRLEESQAVAAQSQAHELDAAREAAWKSEEARAQAQRRIEELERHIESLGRDVLVLREENASARASHDSALQERHQEVNTLCAALETAEQTRAALVSEHERELETIRSSFAERESSHTIRAASLQTEVNALRHQLEQPGDIESRRVVERERDDLRTALQQAEGSSAERLQKIEALERAIEAKDRQATRLQQDCAEIGAALRAATEDREVAVARLNGQLAALQRRLEHSGNREQRWFDNDLIAVAVSTAAGQLVRANAAFTRLFGEAGPEVLRRLPDQWIRATTSLDTLAPLASEGRLPVTEGMAALPDGRTLWYLQAAFIVAGEGDHPVIERWFLDVTARHQIEALQRDRTAVEAVGRVASDFVREVDTHVSEVRRLAAQALERMDTRDQRTTDLHGALLRATRAQEVTQQFLAFSRTRTRRPDWLPLHDAIDSLKALLQQLTGEGVRLTVEPVAPRLQVNASRDALARVLIALVTAATEALPLGGHIIVRAAGPTAGGASAEPGLTKITVQMTGFGQQPARNLQPDDPMLSAVSGSLRLMHDADSQAFELSLRGLEQAPAARGSHQSAPDVSAAGS